MPELQFGFPALDDQIQETTLLLHHEPGLDPTPFLQQAAQQWKGDVVIVTTQLGPERIRALFGEDTWIVDGVSDLLGRKSKHPKDVHVKDAGNIAAVLAKTDATVRGLKAPLLLFDSLSGLAMRDQPERIQAHGGRILQLLDRCGASICIHTDWHDGSDGIRTLFPQHLSLQAIRQKIQSHQYLRMERPDDQTQGNAILFRDSLRGLQAYVPKLVVAGPSGAGKTTFIHNVSQTARSAEYKGSTIGIDRGIVEKLGMRIELFGAPGQERFQAMVDPHLQSAVGVIIVMDATDKEALPQMQELVAKVQKQRKSFLIACNKQEKPGAMRQADLAKSLDIPSDLVIPCTMTDKASAKHVLQEMVSKLLEQP